MSRVEELELAIQSLPPDEFAQIAEKIQAIENERWDRQMDLDASTGKLDFLIAEASKERKQSHLTSSALSSRTTRCGKPIPTTHRFDTVGLRAETTR